MVLTLVLIFVAQASIFIATFFLSEFSQELHLYYRGVLQTNKTPRKILTEFKKIILKAFKF